MTNKQCCDIEQALTEFIVRACKATASQAEVSVLPEAVCQLIKFEDTVRREVPQKVAFKIGDKYF